MPIDPGLLRKHSTFKTYTTSIATYSSVRTFYRPHSQADKLPNNPPLPLLVFQHGLGGSLAQFHPLLKSLVNVAPCLGIDLPGCGLSEFSATLSWNAYSTLALSKLLDVVIKQYCDHKKGQGVVLIGHSMGSSLSTMLTSRTSPLYTEIRYEILGQVSICPKASSPSMEQVAKFQRLLRVPESIFDLWRRWDRRGGPDSASVARFVPRTADLETKKLQNQFNTGSRTPVWRRMAWGALPDISEEGRMAGGLPGPEDWAAVTVPLFLIAGEADTVTKPDEIAVISNALGKDVAGVENDSTGLDGTTPQAVAPDLGLSSKNPNRVKGHTEEDSLGLSSTETTVVRNKTSSPPILDAAEKLLTTPKRRNILKTTILAKPAMHGLLYDNSTYRTVAGLVQSFLADHVDGRLSLGWQLQYLCTEGKWDVKNLAKWQAVNPVGEPIAGIFRAMKTLREIDESHSPAVFVEDWSHKIKAVIDISHESPVYDPRGLEKGGIHYHKFPTVSKIPPTSEEVQDFVTLVDTLRSDSKTTDNRLIGVHCHYGFNRTGFFICSYLIERERFSVQGALNAFKEGRAPGIRHEHFIDTLFVRYCVGVNRTPTL